MARLCRSASLTGFADLARSHGLDPLKLVREAGVPASALTDPDLKIPANAVGWMLEAAAERSGVGDFAIRLAEKRRLSNLGAVGLIAREQPSLRKFLDVLARYQWMQNDALSVHIEEAGEIGVVRLELLEAGRFGTRQAIELCVGVLVRNIRLLLGERWRPDAVCFSHPAPAQLAGHRRVFGTAPLFGQDFNGIVIEKADFDAPLASADPDMARQIARYVDQLAERRAKSARDEVGELIALLLPTGTLSAARVAKHLGVDRRTVHRRLACEGTSFSRLTDETRRTLVESLMAREERSLSDIADSLGFSCASAFSHWFRRVHGASARDYRRARGAAS